MSGRAATPPPNRRSRAGQFLLALGLFVVGVLAGPVLAQDEPDPKRPLPTAEPKRQARPEKYAVPNPDSALFKGRLDAKGDRRPRTGIEDFEPVASETENSD